MYIVCDYMKESPLTPKTRTRLEQHMRKEVETPAQTDSKRQTKRNRRNKSETVRTDIKFQCISRPYRGFPSITTYHPIATKNL